MKANWKVIVVIFFLIYTFVTLFAVYRLYYGSTRSGASHFKREFYLKNEGERRNDVSKTGTVYSVEVWGKAAIGLYLWKHMLNGALTASNAGLVQLGSLQLDTFNFTFRTGPGIIQTTVPSEVQYLILVLNGRSAEKIEASKLWLDYLPLYLKLLKVALVVLGNEQCNNDWLLPYMRSRGGRIDVAFLVYDSPLIDNDEFYQWPLGVAVYRGFPNILPEQVDILSARSHLCNFFGTIYENSSRETLMQQVDSRRDKCIVVGRNKWQPLETEDTLNRYIKALLKSDLTLSPVGMNTECYRIYEALSLGSVPLVEDVTTPGTCDKFTPLRLLKTHNAPLIYIKHWNQLKQVLEIEMKKTLAEKIQARTKVVEWYQIFKQTLADQFVQVLKEKFVYS